MTFKPNPFRNPGLDPYGTPIGYQEQGPAGMAVGALTTGDNPIHSAADATLAAAQFTNRGIEVADGSVVRVVLGDLGGGSFGLKLYQSDGSTAIIDGTSDMFKIAATGTLSMTIPAGSNASTSTTLTGLGTLSTTPAHLSFLSPTNTTSGSQQGMRRLTTSSYIYASQSSGGTGPWQRFLAADLHAYIYTILNGSSQVVVNLNGDNANGTTAQPVYARYYVLQEAAL